jgi:hypothetical protein
VPYRAARDPKGAKYFSCFAVARSAIGHWLVQGGGPSCAFAKRQIISLL